MRSRRRTDDGPPQRLFTEEDHPIQAFTFDRQNKSLDVSIQIRRTIRQTNHVCASVLDQVANFRGEFSQWAVRNVRHGVRSPLSGAGSMPCSRVPPTRILLSEAHDELGDLDHDARTTGPSAPRAVVPFFGNKPSVPREQRVGGDDTGDFGQEFPAEGLTLYCEPASLVVREAKLPPAKPSFEDSVLL